MTDIDAEPALMDVEQLIAMFVEHDEDDIVNALYRAKNTMIAQEAEILRLRSLSEWRTIESAPKDGTPVIVRSTFRMGEASFGICREQQDGHRAGNGKGAWRCPDEIHLFPGNVTHWLPLPPAPSKEG